MSKLMDMIKQLEDGLRMQMRHEEVPLDMQSGEGERDDFTDFPYIEDPEEYKTHRPYEDPYGKPFSTEQEDILEQEDEEEPAPEGGGEEAAPETPEGAVPGVEGGEEGGEEGTPEEEPLDVDQAVGEQKEEKLTAKEIGRVFELKKIYSRLASMEAYLSESVDTDILELRNKVSQALNLFEVVISNFDSYKEQIDEIIIDYYKMVKLVYEMMRDYYKKEATEGFKET
jgi:hypothetical protein